MPELLRIQPQVPRLDSGQLRVPTPGASYIGKGLEHLGEKFEHLQDGADKAEATRSVLDGQAELNAHLQNSVDTISDPAEFKETTITKARELYQTRLESASNPRARRLVEAGLSNDLIKINGNIGHQYNLKIKDKAAGDYTVAKDQLLRSAIGADDENQRGAGRMFGDLVAGMARNRYLTREKAADELVDFNRKVEAESMNLEAATQPAEFIRKQQEGAYKGRDSTAVNRALEISIRVGDARARKDAQEMRVISEAAERSYELQASERRLDIAELKDTARYYGWNDEKVNGLIKMQIGLKAANPYETAVVEDAMSPVYRGARYTLSDVAEAERKLTAASKGGQVDVRTPDYRAAVRELRFLRDRLTTTSDIKERQSTFDARQEVQDLYREFFPRASSKQLEADRARSLREVSDMSPERQRAFVTGLRTKFEKQRVENQQRQVPVEDLRGIKR